VNMNNQLLFPRGNDAPTWPEALALDVDGTPRFHTLHLCPGPHRRKGDVPCGYVYLSAEPELQSCPRCGQYRLVQSGLLVGQPRWFGITFDFRKIWQDRFATPGYSSMLNPTHGRRLPQARPLDDKMENIWDSDIWREKVQECPVMSSERRNPAFSWSQDTVSLTVDKKGGRSFHLYVMRDESLPPDVARKHENLELLGILPNTFRTVDGELRRGKSEYIPFTKYLVAQMNKAWAKGIDVLDADSQPPMAPLCVHPKSVFDVHDYPGGCEIHGQLGSGATHGCIKCHIAGHYLGPGHMGYLDHRRYLPDDHPFRKDPRFGADELRLPPRARTHETMTEDGAAAARLQKNWRRRVYGAQAALGKHASTTGMKNESATASMPGRDDVRDQALEGMHTLNGVVGRVRDVLQGGRSTSLSDGAIAVKGVAESTPAAHHAAPPAKRRASAVASPAADGQKRWEYLAVVAHKNGDDGLRSEYEVLWVDGSKSWEAAEQLLRDVAVAESVTCNAVTVYETDLVARQHGAEGVSVDHDRLRWASQLQAIVLERQVRQHLDDGLNRIPYNPKLLPASARRPLTRPQSLKMRDTIRWGESYAGYQLRAQWPGQETGRIVRQFFALVPRLLSRSVSERDIQKLEIDIPVALAELVSEHSTNST